MVQAQALLLAPHRGIVAHLFLHLAAAIDEAAVIVAEAVLARHLPLPHVLVVAHLILGRLLAAPPRSPHEDPGARALHAATADAATQGDLHRPQHHLLINLLLLLLPPHTLIRMLATPHPLHLVLAVLSLQGSSLVVQLHHTATAAAAPSPAAAAAAGVAQHLVGEGPARAHQGAPHHVRAHGHARAHALHPRGAALVGARTHRAPPQEVCAAQHLDVAVTRAAAVIVVARGPGHALDHDHQQGVADVVLVLVVAVVVVAGGMEVASHPGRATRQGSHR